MLVCIKKKGRGSFPFNHWMFGLVFLAQFALPLHHLLVPHNFCPEHGEWEHVLNTSESQILATLDGAALSMARDAHQAKLLAFSHDEKHEACALYLRHEAQVAIEASAPNRLYFPYFDSLHMGPGENHHLLDRLGHHRLAPKTSPPLGFA